MNLKLFLLIPVLALLASCSGDEHAGHDDDSYYTCPMHPAVRSETPGNCPICGMDLVKKEVAAESGHADMVHLSLRQEKRAGIETDSLRESSFTRSVTYPGRIITDPGAVKTVTSRVPGQITRLYVNQPYQEVSAGQALFEIYSEELNSDIREYRVLLKNSAPGEEGGLSAGLLEGARKKLELWGLTKQEIEDAVKKNSAVTSTYYSEYSGVVSDLRARAGDFLNTGSVVMEITSLSSVWVEVLGYAGDVPEGNASVSTVAGTYSGKTVFSSPVTGSSQSQALYVTLRNPGDLFPGQNVTVQMAGGRLSGYRVPRVSVIPGKMHTVWIKSGKGMYEPRMVKAGRTVNDSTEILAGLRPGDRVVTKGAYLLHSEYVLQKGAGAAHQH